MDWRGRGESRFPIWFPMSADNQIDGANSGSPLSSS